MKRYIFLIRKGTKIAAELWLKAHNELEAKIIFFNKYPKYRRGYNYTVYDADRVIKTKQKLR